MAGTAEHVDFGDFVPLSIRSRDPEAQIPPCALLGAVHVGAHRSTVSTRSVDRDSSNVTIYARLTGQWHSRPSHCFLVS